jgi:hypothetical protein
MPQALRYVIATADARGLATADARGLATANANANVIKFCNGDLTPTQNLSVMEPGDLNPRNSLRILATLTIYSQSKVIEKYNSSTLGA